MTRRKQLASDLEWLADARSDYLSLPLRLKIKADEPFSFWDLDENDKIIYSEVSGMRSAAQALRGHDMWGWLPSWRWSEWKTRMSKWKGKKHAKTTPDRGGATEAEA